MIIIVPSPTPTIQKIMKISVTLLTVFLTVMFVTAFPMESMDNMDYDLEDDMADYDLSDQEQEPEEPLTEDLDVSEDIQESEVPEVDQSFDIEDEPEEPELTEDAELSDDDDSEFVIPMSAIQEEQKSEWHKKAAQFLKDSAQKGTVDDKSIAFKMKSEKWLASKQKCFAQVTKALSKQHSICDGYENKYYTNKKLVFACQHAWLMQIHSQCHVQNPAIFEQPA
eukprot:TRINITY_DN28880_c0_g1_i1.p1 TRINITY_DN28880_c0_g1~~TRINITY_DN28880_c0_g1_i1.p1  ORF type:complete len:224 (+),score=71.99 TRINITY_DN28880_c0_g1_i1:57-728(+)